MIKSWSFRVSDGVILGVLFLACSSFLVYLVATKNEEPKVQAPPPPQPVECQCRCVIEGPDPPPWPKPE